VLTEQITELLRGFDQRQEYHRFAVSTVLCHFGGDLFQIGV